MSVSISEIEEAEFKLVDAVWRLPMGRRRDECVAKLAELRTVKAALLPRWPSVLRKGNDMEKRTHQNARDQRLHDALRDASGGHVCAAYRAKVHSGVVNTADRHMHELHHALVNDRGVKCDAVNLPPGGAPDESGEEEGEGTYFDHGDKETAARADGLAKRLRQPVPRPGPSRFYWEANGARMGLDAIERSAEVVRINEYRKSVGLVPLT